MVDREDFDPSIALPPGLKIGQIRRAVEYVEREASGLVDIYYEQKNVFSAIAGILGTRALDSQQLRAPQERSHRPTAVP